MVTYQVDIIDPKASKLLQDLADMKVIAIRNVPDSSFMDLVKKLRRKAKEINEPSLEDITSEIESIRTKRYAQKRA